MMMNKFNNYFERMLKEATNEPEMTIDKRGVKEWRVGGTLHREDGPAIEHPNGGREWYVNGTKHREGAPAFIFPGTEMWFDQGIQHRVDGPAVIMTDPKTGKADYGWYLKGRFLEPSKRDKWPKKLLAAYENLVPVAERPILDAHAKLSKESKPEVIKRLKKINTILTKNSGNGRNATQVVHKSIKAIVKLFNLSIQEDSHSSINVGEEYQEEFDSVYDGFPLGKLYIETRSQDADTIYFGSLAEDIHNEIDISQ